MEMLELRLSDDKRVEKLNETHCEEANGRPNKESQITVTLKGVSPKKSAAPK